MFTIPLSIAGKDREASTGATFSRRHPLDGGQVSVAAAASVEDAATAVSAAQAAFAEWSSSGPGLRRERLLKAAEVMLAHEREFITRMVAETGATPSWAGFNVALAAAVLREAAALTTQLKGEVIPSDVSGNLAMAIRQPCGVVLGIAPWNAPVILATRAIAAPLACGNTVVLKTSEQCPATHRLVIDVMIEAGFAAGEVNAISNAPAQAAAVVAALIDHPAVRRINFTGSTAVGRIIAERAARQLKPVLLELGGKAPLLVLEDADLDAAVEAAAFGAFFNQGQICMSTERLIVAAAVADDFAAKLAAKARTLSVGDTRSQQVALGSLINPEAGDKLNALIDDAVDQGATLRCGGKAQGALMQATLVDGVTSAMRLYAQESFGPVVAMIRVADEEEAIRVANDSEYGLSAAIFSRDTARALRLARRLESGICHINSATVHDEPQMPFGGVKASGYGRFGGVRALDEFTELRWITLQTTARGYPL